MATTATLRRMRHIIKFLRKRRETLGYSQEYMAAKMGISQNCYSKMEQGMSNITVDRLMVICSLLNLDILALLNQQKPLNMPSDNHTEVVHKAAV